jgi:hypothetical protein
MPESHDPSGEGGANGAVGVAAALSRGVTAFGRFWWDFLVGDTPEIFVMAVTVIAAVALLSHLRVGRGLIVGIYPLAVVAVLCASVIRGRSGGGST